MCRKKIRKWNPAAHSAFSCAVFLNWVEMSEFPAGGKQVCRELWGTTSRYVPCKSKERRYRGAIERKVLEWCNQLVEVSHDHLQQLWMWPKAIFWLLSEIKHFRWAGEKLRPDFIWCGTQRVWSSPAGNGSNATDSHRAPSSGNAARTTHFSPGLLAKHDIHPQITRSSLPVRKFPAQLLWPHHTLLISSMIYVLF